MAAAAPRGAALPPAAAAAGRPACGELRVQLFLSLPGLEAASCVRARLSFGSGSGVADSCVSVERFAGAVVILPLHAGAAAVQDWLSTQAVSLLFESASAAIGGARLSGLDVSSPTARRYPISAPGSSAPLGHVNVTMRLQLWSERTDETPESPLPVVLDKVSVGAPLAPPRALPAARRSVLPSVHAAERLPDAGRREPAAVVALPSLKVATVRSSAFELLGSSRAELKQTNTLCTEVPPLALTPCQPEPAPSPKVGPVNLLRAPPTAERSLPSPHYAAAPLLEPRSSQPPTGTPHQPSKGGFASTVCAPCFVVADSLEYVAHTISQADDCRGGRRQLATLLLTASLLSSPNADAAWSLGTPGDWAVELRPARYAFAIWIALYAGVVIFALFQASPGQQSNPLLRRAGWHAARALVALSAWAAFACAESAQRGMPPSYLAKCCRAAVSAGVATSLFLTLAFLIRTLVAIAEHVAPFSISEHMFVIAPLSLLAGWLVPLATGNTLTAATAVLALLGFSAPPVRGAFAALAVAATGAGAALAVMRTQGNPWFAFSVAWALCGVAWNNTERGVHQAELREPGAPLVRDDDVVFAAAVSAGVVLAAAAVCSAFAVKRKWGPRRGMLAACDGCMRALRGWARSQPI